MPNRYVDFVSDEDFLECVRWVCDAYPSVSDINMEQLMRNTIDPFKLVFDIINGNIEVDEWIKTEQVRQQDKTINNRIGDFHQKLLGKVNGWTDLGVGDESKVDLKKNDNSIFIELKNKYNTMNSDATDKCRDKLANILDEYPDAIAYWAYIIDKNGTSGEKVWIKNGDSRPNLKKAWGKKVYEIVTGDSTALNKVWDALSIALVDILNERNELTSTEKDKLKEFFEAAFEQ